MSRLKIFKSSFVYPQYVRRFFERHPHVAARSHREQVSAILQDGFSFGDAWSHYLGLTGLFEVREAITNAETAQKQWAAEYGFTYERPAWKLDILKAQLAEFKPDVWFCHDGVMTPEERVELRHSCPSIKCVIGYDGALRNDPVRMRGCDIILSCVRASAEFYSWAGFKGYWMPWGFDPRVLQRLEGRKALYDASFCGSIMLQKGIGHFGRLELFSFLSQVTKILLFSSDLRFPRMESALLRHIAKGRFHLAAEVLRRYPEVVRLRSRCGREVFGLEMLQTVRDSKVSLNLHGDGVKTAANIRLFEVTGVGSCLLTDWKDDINKVFEPDREVVTFRSKEECAEKVRYLLDHPREREAIAAAGHTRCLRVHNIGEHIRAFAIDVLRNY